MNYFVYNSKVCIPQFVPSFFTLWYGIYLIGFYILKCDHLVTESSDHGTSLHSGPEGNSICCSKPVRSFSPPRTISWEALHSMLNTKHKTKSPSIKGWKEARPKSLGVEILHLSFNEDGWIKKVDDTGHLNCCPWRPKEVIWIHRD